LGARYAQRSRSTVALLASALSIGADEDPVVFYTSATDARLVQSAGPPLVGGTGTPTIFGGDTAVPVS
jgi:hypothetical protein